MLAAAGRRGRGRGQEVEQRHLDIAAAKRLAGRLNLLPIFFFGFWSVPAKAFWLIMLGVVPWFYPVPALGTVWPWFLGSFLAGPWVLLLPRSFHEPREWEGRGDFYRRVGVERFRSIVANGDLVNRFVRARHRNYHVYGPELEKLVPKSVWNEKRHIAYLCWGMVAAWFAWSIGWTLWAIWLAGSNIGANLYPTMLQRYSRARVLRLARLARRKERSLFPRAPLST
jgi:hypothetical protein